MLNIDKTLVCKSFEAEEITNANQKLNVRSRIFILPRNHHIIINFVWHLESGNGWGQGRGVSVAGHFILVTQNKFLLFSRPYGNSVNFISWGRLMDIDGPFAFWGEWYWPQCGGCCYLQSLVIKTILSHHPSILCKIYLFYF